jgi:hypothetical protein
LITKVLSLLPTPKIFSFMIKTVLILIFIFFSSVVFAQELKSTDSTLKSIDLNFRILKDELVKEEPSNFTGQSIYEDKKGASAIFLPSGGTFRLNLADASLKLSYANMITTKKLFYGFDVSGKTNDGLSSLISNGNISPVAKVNGIIGLKELFRKSNSYDGWLALKIGYEGSSFKLFNPASKFSEQLKKRTFNTFTSSINLNFKIGGNKLLAISAGYQKVNNYTDLEEIELTDTKSFKDSVSNTVRSYESKVAARTGNYEVYDQVPINLDFFWTPDINPRIGFYHYWRTRFTDGKAKHGIGSGLFLLKKNNPLSSVAGLVFDIADISKLDEGFGKNFTVNFLIAYNFVFANRNIH